MNLLFTERIICRFIFNWKKERFSFASLMGCYCCLWTAIILSLLCTYYLYLWPERLNLNCVCAYKNVLSNMYSTHVHLWSGMAYWRMFPWIHIIEIRRVNIITTLSAVRAVCAICLRWSTVQKPFRRQSVHVYAFCAISLATPLFYWPPL